MIGILLPIKPKWYAMIMNGNKTIEVRKENVGKAVQKLIDQYGFADIYAYCTKEEELYKFSWAKTWYENFKHFTDICPDQAHALDSDNLNGKVLFKFRCYKVEEWDIWQEDLEEKLKLACLSIKEFDNYSKGQVAYAIHISELEIFDKPKELSEFKKKVLFTNCNTCQFRISDYLCENHPNCTGIFNLTKAPQSFCYIEVS